jgi:hypothetical protein
LARPGVGRLPSAEGTRVRRKFNTYPIGYFHLRDHERCGCCGVRGPPERPVDGIFGIVIEPKVIRQIDRLCIAAGDSETGGILIGRYTEDRSTAIIAEATPPPPDSRQGHSWFVRGVAGLAELLLRLKS